MFAWLRNPTIRRLTEENRRKSDQLERILNASEQLSGLATQQAHRLEAVTEELERAKLQLKHLMTDEVPL